MVVLVTSAGDVSDLWRLKYGDPPDKRKFLSLLVLPGLLLRLLELVLVLPGLSDAGNGFSVLISESALINDEVDSEDTLDRY